MKIIKNGLIVRTGTATYHFENKAEMVRDFERIVQNISNNLSYHRSELRRVKKWAERDILPKKRKDYLRTYDAAVRECERALEKAKKNLKRAKAFQE